MKTKCIHDVPCSLTTQDSISGRNYFVFGAPVWLPDNGMVGGALQFDGIDDCVITSTSILNPADGVFSFLAWIKGGAPGQAIISQQVASDWFLINGQR